MRTFRTFGITYIAGDTRSRTWPHLIAFLDQVPRVVFRHADRRAAPPPLHSGTIVIAKSDHIGDLLIATPVLKALREQRPHVRVVLMVGKWNAELARALMEGGLCHEVVIFNAWALNRDSGPLRAAWEWLSSGFRAYRRLRRIRPDAFVDLRLRSGNALLLGYLSRIPFRIGFGGRGLSYTLHRELPYADVPSRGDAYLAALPALGLAGARYLRPGLPGTIARRPARFARPERYVLVHFASPARYREVPPERWLAALSAVPDVKLVAIGSATDRTRYGSLLDGLGEDRVINAMGLTSLRELVDLARGSEGGIVIDSVVAHLLLAFDRPTIVLMRPGASERMSFPEHCPTTVFCDTDDADVSTAVRAWARRFRIGVG